MGRGSSFLPSGYFRRLSLAHVDTYCGPGLDKVGGRLTTSKEESALIPFHFGPRFDLPLTAHTGRTKRVVKARVKLGYAQSGLRRVGGKAAIASEDSKART